jgi:hypothetical protein
MKCDGDNSKKVALCLLLLSLPGRTARAEALVWSFQDVRVSFLATTPTIVK